jgi:carboxymethylenebutenolidase
MIQKGEGMQLSFRRPDGKPCNAYCADPAGGTKAPGVVVIQEWWGINDQIRGVADRLAEAGYRALVPDLYRGRVTLDAAEADHLMGTLDFADAAAQDVRGAVQFLKQTSPHVGIVGFCMGGALTILSAVLAPEADAAVSWYGVPPAAAADVGTIAMPLQGHFATQDAFFPIAQVEDLEKRLRAASVAFEFHRYEAAHAFGNETGANHNAKAARLAWERTLTFLGQHLEA